MAGNNRMHTFETCLHIKASNPSMLAEFKIFLSIFAHHTVFVPFSRGLGVLKKIVQQWVTNLFIGLEVMDDCLTSFLVEDWCRASSQVQR